MSWHRRAVLATLRFLFDWRTGLTLLASLVVALVLVVVITGARTTQDALDARQRTAVAASRRIDKLNDRIGDLAEQLVTSAYSNGQQLGALSDQVAALQEQVRQLGGEPVVVHPAGTTSTTQPGTTPTTRPPSSTTTTTAPKPKPNPPRCRGINVLGICVQPSRRIR